MKPSLKTTLTGYYFDTSNPDEAQQYQQLKANLEATPGRAPIFDVIGSPHSWPGHLESVGILLETDFVTDNQWNTTNDSPNFPNNRVFDWWEIYQPHNNFIKKGHYLEITNKMREIRQEILKCSYCGAYYESPHEPAYCTACIDSEYLQESNLHLLQLIPAGSSFKAKRSLSETDYAELHSRWLTAQTSLKQRELDKFKLKLFKLKLQEDRKFDGFNLMIQLNLPAQDAIFYGHTNHFCFGWQSELDREVAETILAKLKSANFPYFVDCKVKDDMLSYKP